MLIKNMTYISKTCTFESVLHSDHQYVIIQIDNLIQFELMIYEQFITVESNVVNIIYVWTINVK
ncbi:hypothetical protein FB2170_04885 [Maribacter sp. HTCC2170]|nr:hypothetical protein FB2170_04885 [Maribacter sp. HTCC2170]